MSGLPSAGIGALLALNYFHMDLSVIAIIGILLLIGIVKKNAIMMVDFALERRREGGMDALTAIREAALIRFRPIIMTTLAALLGSLPIALGTGAGSELRQPLGIAIVGGLCVSQLLTLYITPVVYIYLDKVDSFLAGRRKSKPKAKPGRAGDAARAGRVRAGKPGPLRRRSAGWPRAAAHHGFATLAITPRAASNCQRSRSFLAWPEISSREEW